MSPWLALGRAALVLVVDEVRAALARRAEQKAHAADPRSFVWVNCTACGTRVRADRASLAEHVCSYPAR